MIIRVSSFGIAFLASAALLAIGCGGSGGGASTSAPPVQPSVVTFTPPLGATSVNTGSGNAGPRTITATFNTAMMASSINSTSFYASTAAGPLTGTVSYSAATKTATLLIPNGFPQASVVTANLTTAVMGAGSVPLKTAATWSFTTGLNNTAPVISSTVPANLATGVSTGTSVGIIFSGEMNASTLNSSTFTVTGPAGKVAGSISYLYHTATFSPNSPLSANTTYTVNVTTGVTDVSGTATANAFTSTFTTASGDLAPMVTTFYPNSGQTGAAPGISVAATFNEAMNPSLINTSTVTLTGPTGVVPAVVTYSGGNLLLVPVSDLATNSVYQVKIAANVTDWLGTPLGTAKAWSFTTASGDAAPRVETTTPENYATGIASTTNFSVNFSEPMSASTINSSTITLTGPTGSVSGVVTYGNNVATFTPNAPLAAATTYTGTVTVGVKDVAGTAMATQYTWIFTTQ